MPAPTEVWGVLAESISQAKFWDHWQASFGRVLSGFVAAQIVGVPLGLLMAMSRVFFATTFPLLEIMRPIPPLAWVPASIIFWPTTDSSIAFVIFLGAFFTVVINVIGSARNIDVRYLRAAQSLGSRSSMRGNHTTLLHNYLSPVASVTLSIEIDLRFPS
ncbi:MAG: ABC transporter permease [Hyphomicrobiaceae bacterium]